MAGTELTITVDTLSNGLQIVHRHAPGATEYCGLTINAGSRDEHQPATFGLAHFVEHTIFKGTSRRTDSYIRNRMESVGGELNAFTTKEETTIYAAATVGNHSRACRLIGELVTESIFPHKKIALEREVICDEIDSYLDSPCDSIFDSFDEMVYAGHSLAHNILGSKQTVTAIDSETCRNWLRDKFTANNSVYFYLGPESPQKVFADANRAFAALPHDGLPSMRTLPQLCAAENRLIDNGAHQCHILMGAPIGGLHSPQRFATSLAANILGGPGMNSWLNLALRERRGLVYTVEASTALLSDCGMMTIYFGCDHSDLRKCTLIVEQTLNRLAEKQLTERALSAYKRQYLGQLTLGLDNKEQLALSTGRAILHGLQPPSAKVTEDIIRAISPSDFQDAAIVLAKAPLRTLTLA